MIMTMTNFCTDFLSFHVFSLISIFICSLILHSCIFYLIQLGLMGRYLKMLLFTTLKNQNLLILIFPFFLYLFLSIYFQLNICYMDPSKPVTISTQIGDTEIVLNGSFFTVLFYNLGAAAVFTTAAKISHAILAKHPTMGAFSKIGSIGGVSAGFTGTFKLIQYTLNANSGVQASLPSANIKFKLIVNVDNIENLSTNPNTGNDPQPLTKWFSDNISSFNLNTQIIQQKDSVSIIGDKTEAPKVLSALDQKDPNWAEKFTVNSPLENSEVITPEFKQSIIDIISSNLTLHFVMMYLMFNLIIIISSKLIMDQPKILNSLSKLRDYPLGVYIHYYLIKIFKIWHASSNIWIYFILFCLLIFTAVSAFSFHILLLNLK